MNRDEELQKHIKETENLSYSKSALGWMKKNLNKPVTSEELAVIPGKSKPGEKKGQISHNMRRIFELRDEQGYNIVNYKSKGYNLKNNEWILLDLDPDLNRVKARGVNKRIRKEVFERDNYMCQVCGRMRDDEDPVTPNKNLTLHVGHINPHKNDNSESKNLTTEDFITKCSVCNEGWKNTPFKKINIIDRVKSLKNSDQLEIFNYLKKKFDDGY